MSAFRGAVPPRWRWTTHSNREEHSLDIRLDLMLVAPPPPGGRDEARLDELWPDWRQAIYTTTLILVTRQLTDESPTQLLGRLRHGATRTLDELIRASIAVDDSGDDPNHADYTSEIAPFGPLDAPIVTATWSFHTIDHFGHLAVWLRSDDPDAIEALDILRPQIIEKASRIDEQFMRKSSSSEVIKWHQDRLVTCIARAIIDKLEPQIKRELTGELLG